MCEVGLASGNIGNNWPKSAQCGRPKPKLADLEPMGNSPPHEFHRASISIIGEIRSKPPSLTRNQTQPKLFLPRWHARARACRSLRSPSAEHRRGCRARADRSRHATPTAPDTEIGGRPGEAKRMGAFLSERPLGPERCLRPGHDNLGRRGDPHTVARSPTCPKVGRHRPATMAGSVRSTHQP